MSAFERLAATIAERAAAPSDASYTSKLLAGGVPKIARKLGEEATETIIAALSEDPDALAGEAADLVYHLLVLLAARGLSLDDVAAVLDRRHGVSGLAEKAARTPPNP